MKFWRRLAGLVGACGLIAIVGGCTSPDKGVPSEKKIVIWHWMTDRKDAFSELARLYKKETGVDVEFKLIFPPGTYSMKVTAAARAKTLPDIFGILGEKKTVATFIRAGHIADLTQYMDEDSGAWKQRFYPQVLEVPTFKQGNSSGVAAGIYGVPLDTTVMQFVYNKAHFEALGLTQPPKTFEEFLSQARLAKKNLGLIGFICGWGEGWLLNALATEWAINMMGQEKFLKTIEGKIPYTDREWIEVFSLFGQLKNSGILAPNIATMTNKEAEDAFAREKALFSFNGSWSVNVYRQLNPDLQYGFFSLPVVSEQNPLKVWGGPGASLMVNANSANRAEAVKFLKWLTEKKQQVFLIEQTSNLASIVDMEEELPPILASLADTFDGFTHPDTWPHNEDSRVIETINKGLQQIVMGLKSPEEVAREIEEKKEKVNR
jgi:ABC-type glycerol-3-phosphate transport system substrate-binding protein